MFQFFVVCIYFSNKSHKHHATFFFCRSIQECRRRKKNYQERIINPARNIAEQWRCRCTCATKYILKLNCFSQSNMLPIYDVRSVGQTCTRPDTQAWVCYGDTTNILLLLLLFSLLWHMTIFSNVLKENETISQLLMALIDFQFFWLIIYELCALLIAFSIMRLSSLCPSMKVVINFYQR